MLNLYLHSILAVIIFTPYGLYFCKDKTSDLSLYSSQLIFGIIFTSFIGVFLNFFFPLDKTINTIFLIFSCYILFTHRSIYFTKKFAIFLLISGFIISILIIESHTYRPDAGLYHLPYIKILNEEKIIFGLSNLHFRFGHISIIQYFSAISNNYIFGTNGIVFAPALIAVAVFLNFISHLLKKIKNNEFDLHFFFILGVFIYIFYKMNRYSEYGNDAPAHFLFYYLVSEILILFKKFNIEKLSNGLILSGFIIMNKITLGVASFLPLIFLNKTRFLALIKLKRTYFIITFVALWLIKNVITSGCIIYPVVKTCFGSLIWTDIKTTEFVSNENEAWTKNWPDTDMDLSHKEYIKDFRWLKYWVKNYLPKIVNKLLPFIFVLCGLVFYISYKSKLHSTKQYSKKVIVIQAILLFSIIIWFLKVPLMRYGQSFIISFISLTFAIIISKYILRSKFIKIFKTLIIFGLIVFSAKNFLRISKTNNDYNNYPWPKYLSHSENNEPYKLNKIIINGKAFYKAKNGLCMYSESLCSGMERKFTTNIIKSYYILFREN